MTRRKSSHGRSIVRKTALITGASSGIGIDLAEEFARHGHDLVLLARRVPPMEDLAKRLTEEHGVQVQVLGKDLTAPQAAREVFDHLKERGLVIDYLVNNAGIGIYGDLVDADPGEISGLLQLNIVALTELTRLFAAPMVERGSGGILNVASIAAFQPGPHMATYFASKAYVLSLSEALAVELAPKGVTVTALCPGPTESEFMERSHMNQSRVMQATGMLMDAATVARAGYAGLVQGKAVVIPGLINQISTKLPTVLPRPILNRLSDYILGGQGSGS